METRRGSGGTGAGSAHTTDEFRPRCVVCMLGTSPFPRLRETRDETTRSVHTVAEENVRATLTVAVPAARVFAVLADPTTHSAIDGTAGFRKLPTGRR